MKTLYYETPVRPSLHAASNSGIWIITIGEETVSVTLSYFSNIASEYEPAIESTEEFSRELWDKYSSYFGLDELKLLKTVES